MSGRVIQNFGTSDTYIKKCILITEEIEHIKFPSFTAFLEDEEQLQTLIAPLSSAMQSAISQQYTEAKNWFSTSDILHTYLAPIVSIEYNELNGLPELVFPRFEPLVPENIVETSSEYENNVLLGMKLQALDFSRIGVIKFLRGLPAICTFLGINEDDILHNPSNLGYNSDFGLRIIDYGL